jgi:predicted RNase H-like HicB family nuclease
MRFQVRFKEYEGYWVAEAENGAVSQGSTLEECQENIIDAIQLLEESKETPIVKQELVQEVEVAL